jgi:hypothetical protein
MALYQIVLTRVSSDPATRAYVRTRRAEGLSTREIMGCLKRYVARKRDLLPLAKRQPQLAPLCTRDRALCDREFWLEFV